MLVPSLACFLYRLFLSFVVTASVSKRPTCPKLNLHCLRIRSIKVKQPKGSGDSKGSGKGRGRLATRTQSHWTGSGNDSWRSVSGGTRTPVPPPPLPYFTCPLLSVFSLPSSTLPTSFSSSSFVPAVFPCSSFFSVPFSPACPLLLPTEQLHLFSATNLPAALFPWRPCAQVSSQKLVPHLRYRLRANYSQMAPCLCGWRKN